MGSMVAFSLAQSSSLGQDEATFISKTKRDTHQSGKIFYLQASSAKSIYPLH